MKTKKEKQKRIDELRFEIDSFLFKQERQNLSEAEIIKLEALQKEKHDLIIEG